MLDNVGIVDVIVCCRESRISSALRSPTQSLQESIAGGGAMEGVMCWRHKMWDRSAWFGALSRHACVAESSNCELPLSLFPTTYTVRAATSHPTGGGVASKGGMY